MNHDTLRALIKAYLVGQIGHERWATYNIATDSGHPGATWGHVVVNDDTEDGKHFFWDLTLPISFRGSSSCLWKEVKVYYHLGLSGEYQIARKLAGLAPLLAS